MDIIGQGYFVMLPLLIAEAYGKGFLDLQVFATQGYGQHYMNQMALCMKTYTGILPKDLSPDLPGYACLLGNTLETAAVALAQSDCSFEMVSLVQSS